jgi:hypothetical protein
MKLIACLSAALLLSGCAVYGSWLDKVGKAPQPPVAMSDATAAELSAEARDLRARADVTRLALQHEPDRRQRFRYYEELRHIGDSLVPIERQLLDAGRSARSAAPSV